MTTITHVVDPEYRSGNWCLADDVRGAIPHLVGPDCARLHGLRIVERRCSVCDQHWGDGAVSRHEYCARVTDGDRDYAECVVWLSDGSRLVYDIPQHRPPPGPGQEGRTP